MEAAVVAPAAEGVAVEVMASAAVVLVAVEQVEVAQGVVGQEAAAMVVARVATADAGMAMVEEVAPEAHGQAALVQVVVVREGEVMVADNQAEEATAEVGMARAELEEAAQAVAV